MSDERWLVTGALGCIGTWACRELVRGGHAVTAYDLGTEWHRADLVMTPEERAAVDLVRGDITDLYELERARRPGAVELVFEGVFVLKTLEAARSGVLRERHDDQHGDHGSDHEHRAAPAAPDVHRRVRPALGRPPRELS